VIEISCDRQGWSSCEVDGKSVREATVPLLLEELARRGVAGAVRIPFGGGFMQYPSCEAALRGLTAPADREAADHAISRAMASNKQMGAREAKKNPPPLARNGF
jgi:hypothetical protein